MEQIEVAEITDIASLINEMKINTYYNMPPNFRYKWIKIEKDADYYTKEIRFCWSMEYNYKISGAVGYVHPLMPGGNYVKNFKTEANAKRNLIKRFAKYSI